MFGSVRIWDFLSLSPTLKKSINDETKAGEEIRRTGTWECGLHEHFSANPLTLWSFVDEVCRNSVIVLGTKMVRHWTLFALYLAFPALSISSNLYRVFKTILPVISISRIYSVCGTKLQFHERSLTNWASIPQIMTQWHEKYAFRCDCRIIGVLRSNAFPFQPFILEGFSKPCRSGYLIEFMLSNPSDSDLIAHILPHFHRLLGRECSTLTNDISEIWKERCWRHLLKASMCT